MNTSLQNIITSEKTSLRDDDIRLLFRQRQFPSFQLAEFKKKDELMMKERFQYFIKILEKWNQRVADRDQTLNDCVYTKNQFIFSWLKSLAVHTSKQIDVQLNQLYAWHTSSKSIQPTCFLRKEPSKKVHLQQWEIRNSYKSNLPLEIDNYKRRFIAVPQQSLENSQTRSQQISPNTVNFPLPAQKQNNFLRNNRQAQQIKAYMNNYRKSKVYFYRNMAKNYYQNDFQRDKLSTSSGFYKPKADIHLQIKNYRIKTTMGQRQFSTPINQMNRTCFSNFTNSSVHLGPLGKDNMQVQIPTSNIDGLGLINNPFQLKIKKKKK